MKADDLWTQWYGMGKAKQDFLEVFPAGLFCGPAGIEIIILEPGAVRVAYRYTDDLQDTDWDTGWEIGTVYDVVDAVDAAVARLGEREGQP